MQRIGRTIVRRLLIATAFARIYVCWDPGLEREVVAKIFTLDPATDHPPLSWAEWRERFLREGRILAGLDHVNVLRVFEMGYLADDSPYLMLPYHALTLTNLIGFDYTHPLPEDAAMRAPPCALAPAQALPILGQVMRGLAYLHENGVVHRDIKPSNILLTARINGIVRLSDFGVAKVGDGPDLDTGTWIGSADYVSPEQRRDCGRVTGAADVYAASVMGYRMLTGRRPRTDAEPLPVGGVPERINRIIARGLDPDPSARPSATEFLRVLAQR